MVLSLGVETGKVLKLSVCSSSIDFQQQPLFSSSLFLLCFSVLFHVSFSSALHILTSAPLPRC